MMAIDARGIAAEIVREVAASAEGEVGVDVRGWAGQDLRALLAGLAASCRRLRGVQADGASFAELALPREAPGSARHGGVPILLTDQDAGTLVLAFALRRP